MKINLLITEKFKDFDAFGQKVLGKAKTDLPYPHELKEEAVSEAKIKLIKAIQKNGAQKRYFDKPFWATSIKNAWRDVVTKECRQREIKTGLKSTGKKKKRNGVPFKNFEEKKTSALFIKTNYNIDHIEHLVLTNPERKGTSRLNSSKIKFLIEEFSKQPNQLTPQNRLAVRKSLNKLLKKQEAELLALKTEEIGNPNTFSDQAVYFEEHFEEREELPPVFRHFMDAQGFKQKAKRFLKEIALDTPSRYTKNELKLLAYINLNRAIKRYFEVLEVNPSLFISRYSGAFCLRRLGASLIALTEARATMAFLQDHPENGAFDCRMGMVLEMMAEIHLIDLDNATTAKSYYEEALAHDPDEPGLYFGLLLAAFVCPDSQPTPKQWQQLKASIGARSPNQPNALEEYIALQCQNAWKKATFENLRNAFDWLR